MRTPAAALLLLLCNWLGPWSVTSAGINRSALETDDLRLIYLDATQSYLVPHAARCFENSMQFQRQLWGYRPSERVSVLLSDFSDQGNAAAGYVPRNFLLVETAPLSYAFETVTANERLNWIMNHELVHIATADQAAGSDRFFRKLFQGKVEATADHPETILYFYLTTPRHAAPRWYREGIAVFVETWMAGGLGRAQGPWDEMVFRSMVADGSRFYDPLGLVAEGTKVDFQLDANSYLYGTRFMSYLAYEHSPEALIRWVARSEGSKKYYAAQFKEVFGVTLKEAWREWIAWEHEFQQANLDAIRQFPTTPYEDLSGRALGSVSRAHHDPQTGKLYAAFNYPGIVAHLGAISLEDGSVEKILDIKGPVIYEVTSVAFDPDSRQLFYTTDNHEYRDLRVVDLETKKSRTLQKDVRIGDLAFNPADRSLWGVRHFNGIATLVRVPHPYDEWNQIHSWPYGEVIYNVDVSPDGRLLSASVGEINGRHTLRVMETEKLLAGEVAPIAEVDFGSTIPSNFVFSPDGKYLYGSTYYTGVSNVFRYEVASDALEAVSNTETGFFRPIPLGDDRLIVFRYTGEGFVPARIEATPLEDVSAIIFLGQQIVEKHPVVKEWMVGSPADVPLDSMVTRKGDYQPLKSVGLETIYPVVEGYKDSVAYGFRVNFSDPISVNRMSLTASYSPDSDLPSDERLHLHLKYKRYDWRAFAKYNDADFYDLFGPTKTSRKGYSLGLGYTKTLIRDDPRELEFATDASFHGDLETLPDYQNVDATSDKLARASARLSYRNMRASLGAFDYEKGIKWDAFVGADHVNDEVIPSFVGNLDLGLALPLRHSSIWLRNSAGFAVGDLENPFANFFFGGFGNNWVDHAEIKRYREYYAFPGVELNDVGGRTFAKSTFEWNLPPLRFRRVGTPGFYVSWARASLFASGVETNLDVGDAEVAALPFDPRRRLANVGTQVDFRFTLLSRLNMTLSLGYALAFEKDVDRRDEFMFSLKVLN